MEAFISSSFRIQIMLVDVHTHLTDKAFDEDRAEVINRSKCSVIINNGYTVEDNRKTLALAIKHPLVKVGLGLHPSETAKMDPRDMDKELDFISQQDIVAIGEIGIDGTYENVEQQTEYFKKFVQLALKKDLPMIIHSRKAELKIIEYLEEVGAKKVVMHCFTGKLKLVERAEKNGWYFSIPPNINHSTHFQELVKRVSLSQLLTETDAPYLGPDKGERNEPKYIEVTIKKIAEVKGLNEKEVEKAIFMNYQRLF